MDFVKFQELNKTFFGHEKFMGVLKPEYYTDLELLLFLMDASNKTSKELVHFHALVALELSSRIISEIDMDTSWEVAETFRKICTEFSVKYSLSYLDIENEFNQTGFISLPKKIYLVSKQCLSIVHVHEKLELFSFDELTARIILERPAYTSKQILNAILKIKQHILSDRFDKSKIQKLCSCLRLERTESSEEIRSSKADLRLFILQKYGNVQSEKSKPVYSSAGITDGFQKPPRQFSIAPIGKEAKTRVLKKRLKRTVQ